MPEGLKSKARAPVWRWHQPLDRGLAGAFPPDLRARLAQFIPLLLG